MVLIFIASASLNHEAFAVSSTIRISQVYGGGGNSGAPYQNDFIELFNASSSSVNISGWSIQYAAAGSSSWHATNLSGVINGGDYYLVQLASESATGLMLPTPDAIGTTNMSSSEGKVALVNSTTALSSACSADNSIIDLVGYGTAADCYEGTGPTPTPSNTLSITRASNGCIDTDNNASDFSTQTPDPRNSSSSSNLCSTTGIEGITDNAVINIWSNQNKLYIDLTNTKVVNSTTEIRNLLGQMISLEQVNSNRIYEKEIKNNQAAFIIVKVTTSDGVFIKKVLILNH